MNRLNIDIDYIGRILDLCFVPSSFFRKYKEEQKYYGYEHSTIDNLIVIPLLSFSEGARLFLYKRWLAESNDIQNLIEASREVFSQIGYL